MTDPIPLETLVYYHGSQGRGGNFVEIEVRVNIDELVWRAIRPRCDIVVPLVNHVVRTLIREQIEGVRHLIQDQGEMT